MGKKVPFFALFYFVFEGKQIKRRIKTLAFFLDEKGVKKLGYFSETPLIMG